MCWGLAPHSSFTTSGSSSNGIRTRYKIWDTSKPYFLTCTVVGWLPVFARPFAAEVVLNSWEFLQSSGRVTLYGFVVMENHLHFLVAAPDLAKQVQAFIARQIRGSLPNCWSSWTTRPALRSSSATSGGCTWHRVSGSRDRKVRRTKL